jgi:N-methylhydantoinase A/oxoprolinase/acetone carboxylase beta subunit
MTVRIGVDVGGTFTKAVACDAATLAVVARAIVPTTHDHREGVAGGVASAIDEVAERVAAAGIGPITSVSHSTTQAVNALLEGDTARVGVLALGRRPDLARVRRRTQVGNIGLAPGRRLETVSRVLDVTDGLVPADLETAIVALRHDGAQAIAVSEAFAVDDTANESLALDVAARLGIPACAGHELTGLYGLELRTVTAALNAGILPRALETADVVERAVERAAPGAPLLVMRGDGGAADLRAMRRHPLLTAFSGPAASVAGALRHTGLLDGVVLEVGGTSTNVSVVKEGRPVLAYVRVLDHLTCVRSLDVRVAGIGGGSLIRIERRWRRRPRIADVGPRSAHIAGLPYASFTDPARLGDAEARLVAPREGDPEEYAILVTPAGERFAITLTCAANAVDAVPAGAYAAGNADAARHAFAALGRLLGQPGERLALRVLELAAAKVTPIVDDLLTEHRLARTELVGAGGGAGALLPEVARRRRLPWRLPPDAEVISSVGDALSLVRVELERVLARPNATDLLELHRAAERAAVDAGADPETLQVESESEPARRVLRVVAHGALAVPGAGLTALDADEVRRRAVERLGPEARLVASVGPHHVFTLGGEDRHRFVVVDERGAIDAEGEGRVITGSGAGVVEEVRRAVDASSRHLGPIAVAPVLRVLRGARLLDLSLLSDPRQVLTAALDECAMAAEAPVAVIVSRS